MSICESEGMPAHTTLHKWRERYPKFGAAYARARALSGEAAEARIQRIMDDARAGKIDANTARVLIDAEKMARRQSAHLAPTAIVSRSSTRGPGGQGVRVVLSFGLAPQIQAPRYRCGSRQAGAPRAGSCRSDEYVSCVSRCLLKISLTINPGPCRARSYTMSFGPQFNVLMEKKYSILQQNADAETTRAQRRCAKRRAAADVAGSRPISRAQARAQLNADHPAPEARSMNNQGANYRGPADLWFGEQLSGWPGLGLDAAKYALR